MNDKEIRSFLANMETREEDEKGIIEGMPIVFNQRINLGWFDEIIAPTALDNADLKDVRLCLNHDTSFVYARSRNNNENSTMRIWKEGESGLRMSAKLDIESSPRAADYYTAIKRGDIDKMSFMFSVDADEWQDVDTDHPTRTITGIKRVYEVSGVTFPAYEGTSLSARAEGDALESAKASLESAKAKLAEERARAEQAERRKALIAQLRGE